MSPFMFPSFPDSMLDYPSTLLRYDITENGFLPSEDPLVSLSDPYYKPWEKLVSQLPRLVNNGLICEEVKHLPLLSTTLLRDDEKEWRRAYVVLALITHTYIWSGHEPAQILPPAITIPFLEVSERLEVPPVATYSALCLWNYKSTETTTDFTNSETLRMINTMTGTADEDWFYLISVMVEAKGAGLIPLMLNAMNAADDGDVEAVIKALKELKTAIIGLGGLLERMYERCKPDVFYHQIRPLLAGSKNMGSAGLPNGVFYDEGEGKGEWVQLRGGSNAQSSLVQFFDAVLGVVHKSTGDTRTSDSTISFHEEMRQYMPGPHRRFLEDVTKVASIRACALAQSSHPLQKDLLETYQASLGALSDFRGVHMKMVARYIIVPSRKAAVVGKMNLAVASSNEEGGERNGVYLGTGGTDLIPFLKQTREETESAGRQ